MRLLVIEDEKRLAQNLAELLRRQGYTVDVSSDGVSAVGLVKFMTIDTTGR